MRLRAFDLDPLRSVRLVDLLDYTFMGCRGDLIDFDGLGGYAWWLAAG